MGHWKPPLSVGIATEDASTQKEHSLEVALLYLSQPGVDSFLNLRQPASPQAIRGKKSKLNSRLCLS
jgi:hypothetical protein